MLRVLPFRPKKLPRKLPRFRMDVRGFLRTHIEKPDLFLVIF